MHKSNQPYSLFLLLALFIACSEISKAQDTSTSIIRNEGLSVLMETTTPLEVSDECSSKIIDCYKVTVSIFDNTAKSGFLTDLQYGSDRAVPILNKIVDENCGPEGIPSPSKSFCIKLSDDGRLMSVYRFSNTPSLEPDRYTVNVSLHQRSDDQLLTASVSIATLNFAVGDLTMSVMSDRDPLPDGSLGKMFASGGKQQAIIFRENVIAVEIPLPPRARSFDSSAHIQKKDRILLERLRTILAWLNNEKTKAGSIATIKIDPRDGSAVKPYNLSGFAYSAQDLDATRKIANPRCPNSLDPAISSELAPLSPLELELFCQQSMTIYLVGANPLPLKPFIFQAQFDATTPLELQAVKKLVGKSSARKVVDAPKDTVRENKDLGLRSFKTNLDLGGAFTSSVEIADDQSKKRENDGVFDLMFAPWLNVNLSPPSRKQWVATPFFIDAKASIKEKISKSTLSVNRILIGSDLSLLLLRNWHAGKANFPGGYDQYRFSFRFINASDRDFKRVEAKFNFETGFQFYALNKPLSKKFKIVTPSPLDPKGGGTSISTGNFGFQIQPLVGFEIGKVYRNKRLPFSNENQGDLVRRLYFGLDMKFDITQYASLKILDSFYFRGETEQGRMRNYFSSEISVPFSRKRGKFAQTIFASFERGDLPPFVSPSVNVFKAGYRFNLNFTEEINIP